MIVPSYGCLLNLYGYVNYDLHGGAALGDILCPFDKIQCGVCLSLSETDSVCGVFWANNHGDYCWDEIINIVENWWTGDR